MSGRAESFDDGILLPAAESEMIESAGLRGRVAVAAIGRLVIGTLLVVPASFSLRGREAWASLGAVTAGLDEKGIVFPAPGCADGIP